MQWNIMQRLGRQPGHLGAGEPRRRFGAKWCGPVGTVIAAMLIVVAFAPRAWTQIITPSATNVSTGDQLDISGSGFQAGQSILCELTNDVLVGRAFLGATVADGQGNFMIAVEVPAGWSSGTNFINCGLASAQITVKPNLVLRPLGTGVVGNSINTFLQIAGAKDLSGGRRHAFLEDIVNDGAAATTDLTPNANLAEALYVGTTGQVAGYSDNVPEVWQFDAAGNVWRTIDLSIAPGERGVATVAGPWGAAGASGLQAPSGKAWLNFGTPIDVPSLAGDPFGIVTSGDESGQTLTVDSISNTSTPKAAVAANAGGSYTTLPLDVPLGSAFGEALSISADGKTITGYYSGTTGNQAAIWLKSDAGFWIRTDLPSNGMFSVALAVQGNLVGGQDFTPAGFAGVIWAGAQNTRIDVNTAVAPNPALARITAIKGVTVDGNFLAGFLGTDFSAHDGVLVNNATTAYKVTSQGVQQVTLRDPTTPRGGRVVIGNFDTVPHNIADLSGLGIWQTTMNPRQYFTFNVNAAGTFVFGDVDNPALAQGAISVPVRVVPQTAPTNTLRTIYLALTDLPPGFVEQVQIKKPGDPDFVDLITQTGAVVPYNPSVAGTHSVRARECDAPLTNCSNYVLGTFQVQ